MINNSTSNSNNTSNEVPADIPQTTPRPIGYGHPEYQFVQSIMEMQKSLGEINASIQALNKTVDSTKSKVDDLVRWKHMIVGGAVVLGVIIGFIATIGTKIFDNISFNTTKPQVTQHPQPAQSSQTE